MAIITFSRDVPFVVGAIVEALGKQLPAYKWQVGEEFCAGPKTTAAWRDHQMIAGRSGGDMVFCELLRRAAPLADARHFHSWHVELKRPTTEDEGLAARLLMLVCTVAMAPDDGALCQLLPGGGWLDSDDILRATEALLHGEPFAKIAQFGRHSSPADAAAAPAGRDTPASYAGLDSSQAMMRAELNESFARILHEQGMGDMARSMGFEQPPAFAQEKPEANRLPTMVMLAREPAIFDWRLLREGLEACDAGGDWTIEAEGPVAGTLVGRGARITIAAEARSVPTYLLTRAYARTLSLTDADKAQIETHRAIQSITVDFDTRAADYVDVRQVAKAVTLVIGLAARWHGFVGLYNAGVGTVLPVERVHAQIGILANDEVPIALWSWCAFHSIREDAISISTGGFLPFLGYEVELWNAPGRLEAVAERLNGVLRYLLINGPVIRHGETIGDHAGDRSTRCFHATSRAEREGLPAMLLEFDTPGEGAGQPRADAPVGGEASAVPAPDLGPHDLISLVALTRVCAFPSAMLKEMLDSAFADMRWFIRVGRPDRANAHQIVGEGPAGSVAVSVDVLGQTIPRSLCPPPHKLFLRVVTDAKGDAALARRIALVVCPCLIIQQDEAAHFQLSADGNWLTHDDALTGVSVPRHARDIGDFDRVFGVPPARFQRIDPYVPGAFDPAPERFAEQYRAVRAPSAPAVAIPPRPRPASPPGPPTSFGRRPAGGFGRKGL